MKINRPHQRKDSISNAHVGAAFENLAMAYFKSVGIVLMKNYELDIGLPDNEPKKHCFDLGSDEFKILVECKSHKWTEGGKVPSAKMTTWNEGMFYFYLAPKGYRKIFFTLHHKRNETGETLVHYYQRTYYHLIPDDVEFMEYDEVQNKIVRTD